MERIPRVRRSGRPSADEMERGWKSAVGERGGEISGPEPPDGFAEGREKEPVGPEEILPNSPTGSMDENGRGPSELSRLVVRVLTKDCGASERTSALLALASPGLVFNRPSKFGHVPHASCFVLVIPARQWIQP